MITIIKVMVRDHKTKKNHLHEFWGFGLENALKIGKDELDELYQSGYTITF